jgi:transcriptional regulator with XRE-family HTH domain
MSRTAAKTRVKDKFEEFVADNERRRLYERESLAFDAAELISVLMEEKKVSKAELARRVGKSRAYITQLLSGARNMTMHTLADLTFALGARVEFKARDCSPEQPEKTDTQAYYFYRFSRGMQAAYLPPDTVKTGKTIRSHNLGA